MQTDIGVKSLLSCFCFWNICCLIFPIDLRPRAAPAMMMAAPQVQVMTAP